MTLKAANMETAKHFLREDSAYQAVDGRNPAPPSLPPNTVIYVVPVSLFLPCLPHVHFHAVHASFVKLTNALL